MSWPLGFIGRQGTVTALFVMVAWGPVGCGGKSGAGSDAGGTSGGVAGSGGGGRGGAGGRGGGGAGTSGTGGGIAGTGVAGAAGGGSGGSGGGGGVIGGSGGAGTSGGTGGAAGAGASGTGGGAGSGGRGGSSGASGTGGAGGSGGASGTGGAGGSGGTFGTGGRGGASGTGGAGGSGGTSGTGGAGGSGGSGGSGGGGAPGPSWSTPVNVDMLPQGQAQNPLIKMDAAGNAVAVWRHSNAAGGVFSIYASRFTIATKGWSAPALLETNDVDGAASVDLDVDAAGNAVVVWNQLAGLHQSVWSNRLAAASSTWGTAMLVEASDDADSSNPRVAATGGGGAIVVWHQFDGSHLSIYASRFDPTASAWQGAVPLEFSEAVESLNPDVAADADGNVLAVWEETDGIIGTSLRSSWRNRTTGVWYPAIPFGSVGFHEPNNSLFPRVAVNAATGDGVAVWSQRGPNAVDVSACRFRRSSGLWGQGDGSCTLLEIDERGPATQPDVAIDASGNAVAVWRQSDGTFSDIWASRLGPSAFTWSGRVRLDVDDGEARSPSVAAAGNGLAVAVWMQRGGSAYDIRASRFNPSLGTWGAPSLLDAGTGTAESPAVAMDAAGNAVAIWDQLMGSWYELMSAYHPTN